MLTLQKRELSLGIVNISVSSSKSAKNHPKQLHINVEYCMNTLTFSYVLLLIYQY